MPVRPGSSEGHKANYREIIKLGCYDYGSLGIAALGVIGLIVGAGAELIEAASTLTKFVGAGGALLVAAGLGLRRWIDYRVGGISEAIRIEQGSRADTRRERRYREERAKARRNAR